MYVGLIAELTSTQTYKLDFILRQILYRCEHSRNVVTLVSASVSVLIPCPGVSFFFGYRAPFHIFVFMSD